MQTFGSNQTVLCSMTNPEIPTSLQSKIPVCLTIEEPSPGPEVVTADGKGTSNCITREKKTAQTNESVMAAQAAETARIFQRMIIIPALPFASCHVSPHSLVSVHSYPFSIFMRVAVEHWAIWDGADSPGDWWQLAIRKMGPMLRVSLQTQHVANTAPVRARCVWQERMLLVRRCPR